MSFAEGFIQGFVPAHQQSFSATSSNIQQQKRLEADKILRNRERLEAEQRKDAETLNSARTLAQTLGVGHEDGVRVIHSHLRAGLTPAQLMQGVYDGRYSFTGTPGQGSTVQTAGTLDEQTTDLVGTPPEDADVMPMNPASQAVSTAQASGSPQTAPAVPYNPSTASVPGGAAPSAPAPSGGSAGGFGMRVNQKPATGTGAPATLTTGRVAAEIFRYGQAAASGDPRAIQENEHFTQNVLPYMLQALEMTGEINKVMDLPRAWENLKKAQASGDPEKIAAANADVENLILFHNIVNGTKDARQPVQFKQLGDDGKMQFTQGYVRATPEGVIYVDSQGNRLESGWTEVSDEERKERVAVSRDSMQDYRAYRQDLAALTSGLVLFGQINDIIELQPEVLTSVAGGAAAVGGFLREASAVYNVFTMITSRGNPTEDAITKELVSKGILQPGENLEDFSERILGSGTTDLIALRNAIDAKLILASYRLAGLEGQRGQGLSDRDVARMDRILKPSNNPETFREALAEYMRDKVEGVRRQNIDLRNFNPGNFRDVYQYNPMESQVAPFDAEIDARPEARKGFDFVMNTQSTADRVRARREQTSPATTPAPTPAPQQSQPQAPAPEQPPAPVTITSDEEYDALPSGTRFIAPDGTTRIKP